MDLVNEALPEHGEESRRIRLLPSPAIVYNFNWPAKNDFYYGRTVTIWRF
jgi:hypothetical protein